MTRARQSIRDGRSCCVRLAVVACSLCCRRARRHFGAVSRDGWHRRSESEPLSHSLGPLALSISVENVRFVSRLAPATPLVRLVKLRRQQVGAGHCAGRKCAKSDDTRRAGGRAGELTRRRRTRWGWRRSAACSRWARFESSRWLATAHTSHSAMGTRDGTTLRSARLRPPEGRAKKSPPAAELGRSLESRPYNWIQLACRVRAEPPPRLARFP